MFKLRCEITITRVTSPGTWLPNRDDLYVTIDAFNQVKRTKLSSPQFPLTFHEKFNFEKTFWSCTEARAVVAAMEDLPVSVELRQVADIYLGGALLAYFDTNARDFFYPCSNLCPRFVDNRELLMVRTVDFPGVSPKLEFSSYTLIERMSHCPAVSADRQVAAGDRAKSCAKERSYPSAFAEPGYGLHTVNSALRSRSPSPMERALAKGHAIADIVNHKLKDRQLRQASMIDDRVPFVVRKVQSDICTRRPKLHKHCNYNDNHRSVPRSCKMCHLSECLSIEHSVPRTSPPCVTESSLRQRTDSRTNLLQVYGQEKVRIRASRSIGSWYMQCYHLNTWTDLTAVNDILIVTAKVTFLMTLISKL